MDHRNLDKAMEIFACLITGETVGKENHRELYEAYSSQAEVYDILDAVLKKSNLRLYEYRNTLYITAGDENRVFGYTNDELKKAIGLRLNRELFLAYLIIYDVMTLFYETTSGEAALTYVKTDMVIESTTALLSGVMARLETIVQNDIEENSFRTLALLWDELPLMAENDDISTLKAARGSKTGFIKLVFNFLITQDLFVESAGKYYITDRMRALVENYFDSCKGRLYEVIEESRHGNAEAAEKSTYSNTAEAGQSRYNSEDETHRTRQDISVKEDEKNAAY